MRLQWRRCVRPALFTVCSPSAIRISNFDRGSETREALVLSMQALINIRSLLSWKATAFLFASLQFSSGLFSKQTNKSQKKRNNRKESD